MFITHNSAQLYTVEFGRGPRTMVGQAAGNCGQDLLLFERGLRLIKGAGHIPTMTRPSELAQEIDRYFLEQERYS